MAQSKIFLMIYLFCVNLLSISQIHPSFASNSKSFRLKLTHIDSPHSPLYQENLSDFQRFKKNVEISVLRASHHKKWSKNGMDDSKIIRNNSIQLPIQHLRPHFTAELTLGTPPVKRTLIFDTGSSLTWTQCKPCLSCFEQNQPLFDPKKSSSYKSLTKKHKLAQKYNCFMFGCYYFLQYYGGQTSLGNVAMEDFIFQTSSGQFHTQHGLVFGCGNYNRGILVGDIKEVTGVFGMGKDLVSFARQMGGVIKERFSYCLPTINNRTKQSYLRFGNEATIRGRKSRTTPFLKSMQNTHYKLDLKDISVNGQRLGLKQDIFPGGCVIDSGASVSLLHNKASSAVQMSIQKYFSKFKDVKRAAGGEIPKEFLCYLFPPNFREFPNMTYHFQGADLEIPPVNLFSFLGSFGCLQIMGSEHVTLLGAYQQQNTRFVFDLKEEKLLFAPEDCSKDAD